ncbi:MAG TPA: toxic anion resistance protein [Leptospiraceae bacterium]|nr:toxic anion resistance protein [Leptospiraceae bacterium]HMW05309.1 toxic anion resistance protein [Leptospiraceae bacterium]HMX32934.1 toxic anion resistance protein [Leptospiraceae bacterium]HMY31505.1 toxic anion resistance protein [Leptospiraceae bacterium]HMZ66296.1 toxic anion resistance protein [Leptospiraceae bacterium]
MAENSSTEAQTQAQVQTEMKQVESIENLPKEDQQKIIDLAKQINIEDTQSVLQYGSQSQKKISEFSDQILNQIRAKDAGETGKILTDLMLKVKEMDVESLSDEDSFISKIPLIGSLVKSSQKFIAQYDTLSEQIEKIIDELHKSRMILLKDITLFDTMYAKNLDYFKELNQYILAGEMKLAELKEKELPKYKEKAEKSNDPVDAQKYQDYMQLLNRFEKKLHDLKLTKMLSLQTGPQIRLIQNSNQVLVEKIQSSIINTIPLWKNQLVIAIGLLRQKKALGVQKEVTSVTNELLSKNSEMLKQGTIEVAKEAEKGILEIETLKKINTDLIFTLDETLKIQTEGRQKRQAVEVELAKMEEEIKDKLKNTKQF